MPAAGQKESMLVGTFLLSLLVVFLALIKLFFLMSFIGVGLCQGCVLQQPFSCASLGKRCPASCTKYQQHPIS